MKDYTTLLENYLYETEDEIGKAQVEILQDVNGRETGLIDFVARKYSGNYHYTAEDCCEFLGIKSENDEEDEEK